MGNKCCKTHKIEKTWLSSHDQVDGVSEETQTEQRISITQLLCQTCLYWLIRYCIQNSDLILRSLFPTIHDQVDGITNPNTE